MQVSVIILRIEVFARKQLLLEYFTQRVQFIVRNVDFVGIVAAPAITFVIIMLVLLVMLFSVRLIQSFEVGCRLAVKQLINFE